MNIISIFAGRQKNIEVLKKYLDKALKLKIIDEVHFWNNTRNTNDEIFLKTISNLKRSSSAKEGIYNFIYPIIINNSFELQIKASNDVHIKINNEQTEYEIVLGGWGNKKSVIRENNIEIYSLSQGNIVDGNNYNKFKIEIVNNILNIYKNEVLIISQKIKNNFIINDILFKTGFGAIGNLTYHERKNNGYYFMDTCEKSWKNYYSYYADSNFNDDIIIKCDDDIVFIDLYKLPKFIEFVKNSNYDLLFANTINNGVSAYFQQNKYGLIPKELIDLEYPNNGLCGTLWESGIKAEKLHDYFINNYNKFLNYNYNNDIIPITTRFSINFFGFKGKYWEKIKDAGTYSDDEYILSVEYVRNKNFKNAIYSEFYVSHLSFFKQNETGINLEKLIKEYHKLYDIIETRYNN